MTPSSSGSDGVLLGMSDVWADQLVGTTRFRKAWRKPETSFVLLFPTKCMKAAHTWPLPTRASPHSYTPHTLFKAPYFFDCWKRAKICPVLPKSVSDRLP